MTPQRIYAARRERLKSGLITLSEWCKRRAEGAHNEDTTMEMLRKKVESLKDAVNRAGWDASNQDRKT